MTNSENSILYYIHDPMCSWCWGYRPVWEQLQHLLPDAICVKYVLGGLAPDNERPMPVDLQNTIQGYWRKINAELGTEFNFNFWRDCKPRRSTYPACRAVIAAANQSAEMEMIEAIQRAYYLRAMNPSDVSTLISLAEEIGLESNLFKKDLHAAKTESELQRQIEFVRNAPVRGFPSLVLQHDHRTVPIGINYHDAQETLSLIIQNLELGQHQPAG